MLYVVPKTKESIVVNEKDHYFKHLDLLHPTIKTDAENNEFQEQLKTNYHAMIRKYLRIFQIATKMTL